MTNRPVKEIIPANSQPNIHEVGKFIHNVYRCYYCNKVLKNPIMRIINKKQKAVCSECDTLYFEK